MNSPKRAQRLSFKTIGLETILLDTSINKEVHKLDEVGTFIWNCLDGHRTLDQISAQIVEEYEIDKNVALADLHEFLNSLQSKYLLEENNDEWNN